jgi:protein-S-isoprenylcysteine O-methyltransferase Ste14
VSANTKSRIYTLVQSTLFVLFALVYFLDPGPRVLGADAVVVVVGDGLCLVGVVLLVVALQTIGKSLQIAPAPRAEAKLVTHGVYRVLRHPIYTAIVLILVGLLLRGSTWGGIALGAAAIAFLLLKARYEEKLLAAHYPEYDAYRRSTRGVLF